MGRGLRRDWTTTRRRNRPARFAETLLPLIDEDLDRAIELATAALEQFSATYATAWVALMRAKLGLADTVSDETMAVLATDLFALLEQHRADYTASLRGLASIARGGALTSTLGTDAGGEWVERWLALEPDPDAMDRVNPVYIPRNHLVEEALQAATDGDLAPFERLIEALGRPFDERPGFERYAEAAPNTFGPYTTFCGT